MEKHLSFHLPTIPITKIDIVNRHAAATGSIRYAMTTADASYNGHCVTVSFKPHAVSGPIWNAEYFWAGRVVLGRCSLSSCLRAALDYYRRGDRGSKVSLTTDATAQESVEEQVRMAKELGFIEGPEPEDKMSGEMHAVYDALHWEKHFSGILQEALKFKGEPEEWPAVRETWLDKNSPRARKKVEERNLEDV